jgi:predicted  nucleic acid-binding Zn-ribbon protein
VKKLKNTIQDLERKLEKIKKPRRNTTLDIKHLEKRSGVIDASITNRIQKIEKRFSGAEDTIENIDTTFKENAKFKNLQTPNIQETRKK